MSKNNQDLVEHLEFHGVLISEPVQKAFSKIDRKYFIREEYKSLTYEDIPLSIGYGQTISQPTTVAIMLELLELKANQKILDIGYGSGYATALLAVAIGKGKIFALELNSEIAAWGKKNIDKYNFISNKIVDARSADGSEGLMQEAPFDRILVSAEASAIPKDLKKQLKLGGVLVIPCKGAIHKIRRKNQSKFETRKIPGFVFVPLLENKQKR